ncbi:MAG TPA: branched-chain amino acid transport system II carrier protein [Candidatus Dorea intestinavium]|nr:branched-chain amino acid transport system II carrier protein [Candidatus Dorea intestinavium]
MNKKLTFKENFFIGSMLFGMFFGAGNLIFPVHMGQEAGASSLLAAIGFIVTATGLPFLGVLAIGISDSNGLRGLASRIGKKWGYFFTALLYLTIGPFFAYPRTGTVSYEIGLSLFFPKGYEKISLLIFTIIFFGISLAFALKPGKLVVFIGKVLNPIFLVLMAIMILATIFHPMGKVALGEVQDTYQKFAFFKGFTEGYNTMDALSSLAFGVLVTDALKRLGVEKPKEVTKSTIKTGLVSVILMIVIYSFLTYMGATSLGKLALSENGGIALAEISRHYFGGFGNILLAVLVAIACLKTAIGLTSSCAEAFVEMFPNSLSYRSYAILFTVLGCAIANVGLTKIIALSIPVLMFLYPLAIVLIVLTMFSGFYKGNYIIYKTTTYVTLIFAIGEFLKNAPVQIAESAPVSAVLNLYAKVPFYEIGMGWVIPALIGALLGIILMVTNKKARS